MYHYFIKIIPENLFGVHVAGEKRFHINGEDCQQLEWEEYGFRMQVPEGATSEPCDFAVKAIIAGQFEFPESTELVSAVYAISASRRLNKPVTLEIEHCVGIENKLHSEYLSFGIARCDQPPLPYTFELKNGIFSPKYSYGAVLHSGFSLVGVLKGLLDVLHTPSSTLCPPESETKFPVSHDVSNSQIGTDEVGEDSSALCLSDVAKINKHSK